YDEEGDYSKALEYYFKALKIDEEMGNKREIASILGNIGSLYTETGRFAEAKVYLDSALVLCEDIGLLNYTMNFEKSMSHLCDTTARYKQALTHYKKYTTAKDSLFNEEKAKNIGRLEQKHEIEMAELKQNQEEEERSRQLHLAVSRRNSLQYSGIVLGLVFLFMGIFIGARRFGEIKARKTHQHYVRVMEGALFISFLIFFEFVLVLLDNHIEQLTGGEPLYKLLINALLAGAIFPLHSFLEAKLKGRVIKTKDEKQNVK
ncbi:MAG: tetratricopeptide repeat protein, partial [Bacteroidia bacterium]|nr:tetratricopeptide repeat protein [Bacteroidia bacterium]